MKTKVVFGVMVLIVAGFGFWKLGSKKEIVIGRPVVQKVAIIPTSMPIPNGSLHLLGKGEEITLPYIGLTFKAISLVIPTGWEVNFDKTYNSFKITNNGYALEVGPLYEGSLCFFDNKQAIEVKNHMSELSNGAYENENSTDAGNLTYGDFGEINTTFGKYRINIVKSGEEKSTFGFCGDRKYVDWRNPVPVGTTIGDIRLTTPYVYQETTVKEALDIVKGLRLDKN